MGLLVVAVLDLRLGLGFRCDLRVAAIGRLTLDLHPMADMLREIHVVGHEHVAVYASRFVGRIGQHISRTARIGFDAPGHGHIFPILDTDLRLRRLLRRLRDQPSRTYRSQHEG